MAGTSVQLVVYARGPDMEWDPGDRRIAFTIIMPDPLGEESLRALDFETPSYLTRERGSFADLVSTLMPPAPRKAVPAAGPLKVPSPPKRSLLTRLSRSLSLSQ